MRRRVLVFLLVIILALATGFAVLLVTRQQPQELSLQRGEAFMRTGREVPLEISELPRDLEIRRQFQCYEVRLESGGHSVEILDGEFRSKAAEALRFHAIISATASGQETSVRQVKSLHPGEGWTSFGFYDDDDNSLFRTISPGLTSCSMRFEIITDPF